MQGPYAAIAPVPLAEARSFAEGHGYEYLESLTSPSLRDDPHRVKCRYCGRISAERLGDIGFGCSCQVNPSRSRPTPNVSGPKKLNFLKDSGLPVLDWWDHDANDAAVWETVTEAARREVHWRCPHCGTCFTARVLDMVGWRECPECEPKRRAAEQAELERLADTPIAAIPALLEAWADEADPATVPAAGGYQLRRFRCPRGHYPRMTPLSYLRSGCPSCRGQTTLAERLAAVEIDPSTHGMNPEIATLRRPPCRSPQTATRRCGLQRSGRQRARL
jgi:Probable Zinc-ribbon domain